MELMSCLDEAGTEFGKKVTSISKKVFMQKGGNLLIEKIPIGDAEHVWVGIGSLPKYDQAAIICVDNPNMFEKEMGLLEGRYFRIDRDKQDKTKTIFLVFLRKGECIGFVIERTRFVLSVPQIGDAIAIRR